MSHWPLVECRGSAEERGATYGEQARESIRENIELYRDLFHERFGVEWEKVRRWAARFVPRIEEFDPDLTREMQAIAHGAAVDFLDIVSLNTRSSFHYPAAIDGCTTIAHIPAPGEDGAVLLAQNWDNMAGLKAIVLKLIQPGKPSVMTFTEAGMVGKMGLNDRGIALCVNGLFAEDPLGKGLPIFFLMRKALESRSLSEAIGVIAGNRRDAPHNYMLASGEGAAFDVEALSREYDVLTPAGRFLAHTNHIISQRIMARDEGKALHPNTVVRLWRAERLLSGYTGRFTVADMQTVLGDHFDPPISICNHGSGTIEAKSIVTKCCIIMEPAKGAMHLSAGNPCRTSLETFTLI